MRLSGSTGIDLPVRSVQGVELSSLATRYVGLADAVAAGCERLVHGAAAGTEARRSQRRFIGTMLCAPFFAAGAAVTLVTSALGASVTLAVIFAVFGFSWLAALSVSASGRTALAGGVALAAASVSLGLLVAAAGGLASPVALLALALPVEAFWVAGSRRAAFAGGCAALGAVVLQMLPGGMGLPAAEPAAWHWLLPLAWAATLPARLHGFREEGGESRDGAAAEGLAAVIDAVVLHLSRQGDVIEAGGQARSILNLAPDLLAGTGLFDRIHLADRIAYLNAVADMRDGAGLRKVELRIRLPQDKADAAADNYRPFALELMPAGDAGEGFVALLRDNGEVEELRRGLARANEEAASADVAKGRFLAAVSHELRTPLNAVIGFSDMLMHEMFGPFGDPRQKEYVGLIRDSGRHLLDVVTSILDVSRIEAGAYRTQVEPFRFADAVEMTRSMMQLQAEAKGVAFDARIAADVGEVNADRRAMQQILINLASNAIKFTPAGGDVTIGAQRLGSRLHFWVRDTGIGIAEDDLATLGQPFVQVQNDYTRRFEGTGLGLSLVKGLVALHDGTMSIESMPGEGTTVSVSVPVDGPKPRPDKVTALAAAATVTAPEQAQGGPNRQGGPGGSLRKTA